MIIRPVEICPKCGQWMPWRKVSSRVVNGERRLYVRCVRCGAKETIAYSQQEPPAPERGTK